MRLELALPVVVLLASLVGLVLASSLSRRRARLMRRVEAVVPARIGPLVVRNDRSLRMRSLPPARMTMLARFIQLPLGLPLANVVPPVSVFIVAALMGMTAAWFGHLLAGWYVSTLEGLVTAFVVLRLVFGWEIGRYRARLVRQLPDAVQLVISATRAGLPVTEAFQAIVQEMPSPTSDEFQRVVNEISMNVSAEDALLNMHRRTGVTEYAIFAVTIGVQARSGGRLAETIQNLADTVRERLTIAARANALASEAKVSAIIMAILPVIAAGLMSLTRPGHLDPLFNDPRGIRLSVIGVTTLALGIVTMRQLIRGATKD
ncbi:MAG: type II secretion system F family protein [Acetobacteraceae bacterium]